MRLVVYPGWGGTYHCEPAAALIAALLAPKT